MKTITEWLDMLKEPYRTEALAAFKADPRLDCMASDGKSALRWGFYWANNGGYKKWNIIADNFNSYIDTNGMLEREYNRIPKPIRDKFDELTFEIVEKQKQQMQAGTRTAYSYSARTLVHVIRYYTDIHSGDSDYKVNNNISSCLSRMFVKRFPSYKGIFELRKSKYD